MDNSYMRDELCYDIANKIGLPTTKNSFVRLYINNQPIGLFGLVEVFKNPWIRNEFADGDKKYNQGAFYVSDTNLGQGANIPKNLSLPNENTTDFGAFPLQGTMSDLSYLGENVTLYEAPYQLKEKPSVGVANYTKIKELTKFISQQPNNTMVDDSYAEGWEKLLDVESVIREIAFEILVSDLDSYLGLGNNYILYDDLGTGRIIMSAQDFDLTMGLIAVDSFITGNYSSFTNFNQRPLTASLFKVPKYKKRLEELLYNLTKHLVNPGVMYPRIDSLSHLLSEDVEWDKSLPRVSNGTFSFVPDIPFALSINGTYSSYIAGHNNSDLGDLLSKFNITSLFLKEWVKTRSGNILTFFNDNSTSNSHTFA